LHGGPAELDADDVDGPVVLQYEVVGVEVVAEGLDGRARVLLLQASMTACALAFVGWYFGLIARVNFTEWI